MIMKLFVVFCVLYTVPVLAGPINSPISSNCQDLEDEIELANFKMRQIFSRSEMSYNELEKSSQNNVKLSLKQLREAIKGGKGTKCGDNSALEQKFLETKFKQDLKLCKTKVNFRELQKSASTYMKELKGHADMIDKYCAFISKDEKSVPNCVDESVSACQASLYIFENRINRGLAQREKEINDCYHNLTESIYGRSLTLQNDIQTCMEAAKDTTIVEKNHEDENHGGEDGDNSETETTEAAIEDGDNGGDGDHQEGIGDNDENNPIEGHKDDEERNNEEAVIGDNSNDDTETNEAEEEPTADNDDEFTNFAEEGNIYEEEQMPGRRLAKSLLAGNIAVEVTTVLGVGAGVGVEVEVEG